MKDSTVVEIRPGVYVIYRAEPVNSWDCRPEDRHYPKMDEATEIIVRSRTMREWFLFRDGKPYDFRRLSAPDEYDEFYDQLRRQVGQQTHHRAVVPYSGEAETVTMIMLLTIVIILLPFLL